MMSYAVILSSFVLLYATIVMSILLGINSSELNLAKKILLFLGVPAIIAINIYILFFYGTSLFGKFYPLISQLPIFILFCIISKRSNVKVFFVLITTIFLTFPFSVLNGLAKKVSEFIPWRIFASLTIIVILVICIKLWLKEDFNYVMEYFSSKDILKFCAIPIFYNILNYSVGNYSILFPVIAIRGLNFMSTLAAYILIIGTFRRTREMRLLQNEYAQLMTHIEIADAQLISLRKTQEQAAIYRHDMRHHFSLINGYLADGKIENAVSYISKTQLDMDAVIPAKYCLNNTINLIVSYFISKGKKFDISFAVEADIPANLPFPETEICAILSNGLENAITATSKIQLLEKNITLKCYVHKNMFLIYIENPYDGEIKFAQDIPQTDVYGHGFGTKSISLITNNHGGYCSFKAENGIFALKVALPLPTQ